MRKSPVKSGLVIASCLTLVLAGCSATPTDTDKTSDATESAPAGKYTTREVTDGTTTFTFVTNPGDGKTLSFSNEAGFKLIEEDVDGNTLAFKDMNGNGTLDKWEDWRLEPRERATDLAPQLTTEQIAGLMLFSGSERAPSDGLTKAQQTYLSEDHLRLILNAGSNNVEHNVTWSNEIQAFVESVATADQPYVPVNFSTDPRSDASGGYSGSATDEISQWPGNLAIAATFDAEVAKQFGQMASMEYRALGMTNALSPQIDVATEPRWLRVNGTFGESADLSAELTEAFVAGFQNTYDENGNSLGWGDESVSTVIKHFAGDSAGESGRASYNNSGKFAVFPGDNFDEHVKPFLSGLDSAGLMTTYSILVDGKGEALFGDPVAGAFNKDMVDIMRVEHDYQGVIITDWGVTAGGPSDPDATWFTSWGVEDLTVEERHFLVLKAGIDMFGGNTEKAPVLAAYDMWNEAFVAGELEIDADARFTESAVRILDMIITSGLYESPFLDLENSLKIVGSEDRVAAGYEAQKNSVVVLKNDNATISCEAPRNWKESTVYIPATFDGGTAGAFNEGTYVQGPTVDLEVAAQYFGSVVTDDVELDADGRVVKITAPDLTDVDVALVGLRSPNNGYDFAPTAGYNQETDEYYPLSLQYRPYVADGPNVRKTSISGDLLEDGIRENRSYFGNTSQITNEADLDAFERAVTAVEATGRDIPVLTMLRAKNPIIPAEFEAKSDAITVGFDISEAALIEVTLGLHESAGRLPLTFPADMDTVEANQEDVPFDLTPYVDSAGNKYEFGFGLSCAGTPIK